MSGARFPPDMALGIQAIEFNHCFIRPENLLLMVWESIIWQSPGWWSSVFFLVEGSFLSTQQCWSSFGATTLVWLKPFCSFTLAEGPALGSVPASMQSCLRMYKQFLGLYSLLCALIWTIHYDCIYYRQTCAFPNHVQSTEFTTGGLQSSCRNIWEMISANKIHLM